MRLSRVIQRMSRRENHIWSPVCIALAAQPRGWARGDRQDLRVVGLTGTTRCNSPTLSAAIRAAMCGARITRRVPPYQIDRVAWGRNRARLVQSDIAAMSI